MRLALAPLAISAGILASVAGCAPKKQAPDPRFADDPPQPPSAEALALEEKMRAKKRAEREKLGERVGGDRAKLFRAYGFPDGNSSGSNDVDAVARAEWWMYGKRFRRLPDGTGEFECREVYYFDGDKTREKRVIGSCK